MLTWAIPLFIVFIAVLRFLHFLVVPPIYPRNLPSVPFYVALIPFIWNVDQAEIYRNYVAKKLHKFGAVKIFFGGRWNVLVTRPAYIAEVLKNEDVYKKTGNHIKIPYSVVAEYTGDNIISSHGHNWRLYKGILQPGLQKVHDLTPIQRNSRLLCDVLYGEQNKAGGTIFPLLMQRHALANLSQCILQADFKTYEDPIAPMHILQLAVKREIFKPMYMNFPFFDLVPVPSRMRARKLVREFAAKLTATVLKGHEDHFCSLESDQVGCRLVSSRREGVITEKQFRDNCISVVLAGHENPQLQMVSMFYLLAKNKDAQTKLRAEIATVDTDSLTTDSINNLPYLTSIIYESLRLFPPISQLINRCVDAPVVIGEDITIPANTFVGYNSYATNRDPLAWGETAEQFIPERWGKTVEEVAKTYRRAVSKSEIISFHGGRRACLGERFAMLEIRVTAVEVLKRFEFEVDPSWGETMTGAGPLYPKALRLRFRSLEKSEKSLPLI